MKRSVDVLRAFTSLKDQIGGNDTGVESINDSDYKFSLWLINQEDQAIRLRRAAIDELVIIDDMTELFHKGSLTINNSHDALERGSVIQVGDDQHSTVNSTSFHFRSDARDLLYIRFEPSGDNVGRENSTAGSVDDEIYTIEFCFIIYAMEDVLDEERGPENKKQRLYFHDYRYQMLLEKNIYYSTAKNLPHRGSSVDSTTPVTMSDNESRSKPTGEIVQDILTSSLFETDTLPLFSGSWEYGDEKLMYTSPSNNKAVDDLEYILGRHVSSQTSDNQPCILKLERKTDRWELLPVSAFYTRATTSVGGQTTPGLWQSEAFKISSSAELDSAIPPESKAFHDRYTTPHVNYHFSNMSIINDYTFTEMSGLDCQTVLNSTIVHSYNEGGKRFNIDFSGNVTKVEEMYKKKYLPHMIGSQGQGGKMTWLPSRMQQENINIKNVSSPYANTNLNFAYGRNKTIIQSMLLGNAIQFELTGITARRSGVWMTVNRDNTYVDNEYESKVLGQYLVRRVEHKIAGDKYTTVITGIKPYYFKDLGFNDKDILHTDIRI